MILVFAGTSEGRKIAEYLAVNKVPTHICVATEYGEILLPDSEFLVVSNTRLDQIQMEQMLDTKAYGLVIDATHPYAIQVSENIRKAAKKTGITCIRVCRDDDKNCADINSDTDSHIYVNSVREAADYLNDKKGNVLITTGSKEMEPYLMIPDAKERLFFRVLSTAEVLIRCKELHIEGRHLFAMQGPFSEAMNYAMLNEIQASFLVTKDSGGAGGFREKIEAADKAGIQSVIIRRPEDSGLSFQEVIERIDQFKSSLIRERKVSLVGIGPGCQELLTNKALQTIENADLVIGADRMLAAVDSLLAVRTVKVKEYRPYEIIAYIKEHSEHYNIAVLYSGDICFYSGAIELEHLLKEIPQYNYEKINGISSTSYFMSRIGISLDQVKMMSLHGKKENVIAAIKRHDKVMVLMGGESGVSDLAEQLTQNELPDIYMTVGENLSYPDEKITMRNAWEWKGKKCNRLAIVYLENPKAEETIVTQGIADCDFVRGKVPMTKMEIRSISISKLQLKKDAVLYDIGAGTGSISVEAARLLPEGRVYAIEKEEEACKLIASNLKKFGVTSNVTIITGRAPECIETLPVPTHAFIGGSTGNMKKIIQLLLNKNSDVKIVINAIALDTLTSVMEIINGNADLEAEFVQALIVKDKEIAGHRMLFANNPVFIISVQKKGVSMIGERGKE